MNQNTDIYQRLQVFYRNDPDAMEMIQHALENDEPIQFCVLWEDDIIGTLYIKGPQHKYVPDKDMIQELEKKAFILKELAEPQDWGRPIPFLQQMIDNCLRFPEGGWIGYQTSHFSLELLKDKKRPEN